MGDDEADGAGGFFAWGLGFSFLAALGTDVFLYMYKCVVAFAGGLIAEYLFAYGHNEFDGLPKRVDGDDVLLGEVGAIAFEGGFEFNISIQIGEHRIEESDGFILETHLFQFINVGIHYFECALEVVIDAFHISAINTAVQGFEAERIVRDSKFGSYRSGDFE